MGLKWLERNRIGKEKWDRFLENSDEAWLWHFFDFQDALACWPSYSDLSFGVLDALSCGEVLCLMPLHLLVDQSIVSLGGPAFTNGIPGRLRHRSLGFIRDHLVETAQKYRLREINVSLPPMARAYSGERCPRVNPLLEFGCENTLTQTWVVDLRSGKEEVWDRMEGRARTAIRKAEKSGIRVREARNDDLESYYKLHVETYDRTGVPPHPKDYFKAIWNDFLAAGLAHIFIAEMGEEAVAAENFGTYQGRAVYWTGAASAKGLSAEANSLIQWTAIQWMIDRGFEYYETGEAFPGIRVGKEKGLNDFKKSFGGELYPFYKGRLLADQRHNTNSQTKRRLGDRLLDISPRKLLDQIKKKMEC